MGKWKINIHIYFEKDCIFLFFFFFKETFLISVALIFVNVVRTDACKPAGTGYAKNFARNLHEAGGMHQTSKGLSLSTFQFLQSTKSGEILRNEKYLEIVTIHLQFLFCNKKVSTEFAGCIKLSHFQFIKRTKIGFCWFWMTFWRR